MGSQKKKNKTLSEFALRRKGGISQSKSEPEREESVKRESEGSPGEKAIERVSKGKNS